MEKKANAEDEYFRSCQREAASEAATVVASNNSKKLKEHEISLFGKQGAQGINFSKYNDIKVEVKTGESSGSAGSSATKKKQGSGVDNITFNDYDELQLPTPQLKNNIKLMNYTKSTPIQRHAIPLGIAGHDLMCCAQTGSGKTCAFLLPVVIRTLTMINNNKKEKHIDANGGRMDTTNNYNPVSPNCIVLAPTRELASQIELEAQKLCFNQPSICPVAVYGGASQQKQLRQLAFAGEGGNVIIVATPGRYVLSVCSRCMYKKGGKRTGVCMADESHMYTSSYPLLLIRLTDFVERNIISLREVKYLVLDEADRMLDMGK